MAWQKHVSTTPGECLWVWKALTSRGEAVCGFLAGPDAESVHDTLVHQNLFPVCVRRRRRQPRQKRIPEKDILDLFRQMLHLAEAGIPLFRWMEILAHHTRGHPLELRLLQVRDSIRQGHPLSTALGMLDARAAKPLIRALVRHGEHTGQMTDALRAVVENLVWQQDTRHAWASKTRYPLFLCLTMAGVLLVFSEILSPRWALLLQTPGIPLSFWTRSIMVFLELWPRILAVTGIAGGLAMVWSTLKTGHPFRLLARSAPFVRDLVIIKNLRDWTQVLSLCLGNRMPLPETLDLARMMAEPPLDAVCLPIRHNLKQGMKLGDAMAVDPVLPGHPAVPRIIVRMVQAAEYGQNLDQCFRTLTRILEETLNQTLTRRLQWLEPLVLVLMTLVTGALVTGLLYPLWNSAALDGVFSGNGF